MQLEKALSILGSHKQDIKAFHIKSISIFGSVARNEAAPDSDIDLLVEFFEPVGLFEFVRLKTYLENILGTGVDLVTLDALKHQLREQILKEAIYAA